WLSIPVGRHIQVIMDDVEYTWLLTLSACPTPAEQARWRPHGPYTTEETFRIIQRQAEHRRYRGALRTHRQEKMLSRYAARRRKGDTISAIARSVDFSPCMLARVLLENVYGWPKPNISSLFKELVQNDPTQSATAQRAIQSAKDNADDVCRLMVEVKECIETDAACSPLADRVRHNMGVEYEYVLLEKLRNRGLVFESEDVLREKGLAKTPDVRLLLPIGVYDQDGTMHVVHWIDSKAMFGDRHVHDTENAGQLQGYVNRFGPGMVIYWFGHVANLSSDSDVFITHEFPERIAFPGGCDPLETASNSPAQLRVGAPLQLRPVSQASTTFDDTGRPTTRCRVLAAIQ
ncbi:TPA: hypothetical protein N0F65_002741, partial [Lagenidium giganteum]